MLKEILKLKGAQILNRAEQKIIKGGLMITIDCVDAISCEQNCSGICQPRGQALEHPITIINQCFVCVIDDQQ